GPQVILPALVSAPPVVKSRPFCTVKLPAAALVLKPASALSPDGLRICDAAPSRTMAAALVTTDEPGIVSVPPTTKVPPVSVVPERFASELVILRLLAVSTWTVPSLVKLETTDELPAKSSVPVADVWKVPPTPEIEPAKRSVPAWTSIRPV